MEEPIRSSLELMQPFLLSEHKSKKNELDLKISRERILILVTESFASKYNCLHGEGYTLHMSSFSFYSEITPFSHLIKEQQLKTIRYLFLV